MEDERKEYLDERKILLDIQKETASLWDKTILTLSASALGFSLSFVKGNGTYFVCNSIMIISWISFGLSIITILINMLTSQKYINSKLDSLNNSYVNGEIFSGKFKDKQSKYHKCIKNLNVLSLSSFIFGIVFLIIFISINFEGAKTMANDEQKKQINKLVDTTKTLEEIKDRAPVRTTTNTSTKK